MVLCRAWLRSDRTKESLCQLQSPDPSLTALASSFLWLRWFFSYSAGLGDRIPVLCAAAVGTYCLTSFSLRHPHPKEAPWAFPEVREKASATSGEDRGLFISAEIRQEAAGCLVVQGLQTGHRVLQLPVGCKAEKRLLCGGSQISRWPGTQTSVCLHGGKETAWPGPRPRSHMFWVILQAADEFTHRQALVAYSVHSGEQRELIYQALFLEDVV